jgi:hypothetical protein
MNKSAVALAADSKVTIGSVLGGKTFDTVDKVFMLSKIHLVGLMVFGNAEFMRYPWETIVKIYRSQNGARSYRSIHLWGNDFVRYLSRFEKLMRMSANKMLFQLSVLHQSIFGARYWHNSETKTRFYGI